MGRGNKRHTHTHTHTNTLATIFFFRQYTTRGLLPKHSVSSSSLQRTIRSSHTHTKKNLSHNFLKSHHAFALRRLSKFQLPFVFFLFLIRAHCHPPYRALKTTHHSLLTIELATSLLLLSFPVHRSLLVKKEEQIEVVLFLVDFNLLPFFSPLLSAFNF